MHPIASAIRNRIHAAAVIAAALVLARPFAVVAQSSAPKRTLTEIFRLDAGAEDFSALTLTRQGNTPFYVGPRRDIVVPLQQDASIRLYDSTGKRVASIGRRGSGPGEFRNIFRLGWTRDTMWVYDAAQRRVSYFDSRGTHARTVVLSETLRQPPDGPDPHVISDFAPSAITTAGSLLGQILVVNGRAPEGWLLYKYFVASIARDNTVRQLAEIPAQAVAPRAYINIDGPAKIAFASVPFANDALYAFSTAGDRFAIVTTDHKAHTYSVSVFKATGETIFTRAYPFRARTIPKNVADSAAEIATKNVRQPPDAIAALQKKVREAIPAEYPPVGSVVLARDGTTWIRLNGTADGDLAVVLSAKGDVIANVPLTRNLDIVEADGLQVWAVDIDADGLGSIVMLALSTK